MVREVIGGIREAEAEAERILEEGKRQARAIAAQGQADARAYQEEIENAARNEAKEILANTEAFANKRANLLLEESVQTCEQLKQAARGNMPAAVALILESV